MSKHVKLLLENVQFNQESLRSFKLSLKVSTRNLLEEYKA